MNVLRDGHDNDPLHATEPLSSLPAPGFAERLLQVGEIDPADHDQGRQVFRLIQEIFPIESQLYGRAIDRLLDLLEDGGASADDLLRAGNEARLLLGLTLVPFVRSFTQPYRHRHKPEPELVSMTTFRRMAHPWALAQLKHSVAYIVALELQEHHRQVQHGGLDKQAMDTLGHLRQVIDGHGDRPEAAPLVQKATEEYRLLADQLARHSQLNTQRPRTLSYLLSCTSRGELRDVALAALILKGNNSPGAEASANPLQILDVPDVATVVGLERGKVTSGVSKIRRRAAQNPRVDPTRQYLDPSQLWRWVHLPPSEPSPVPANQE